MNVLLVTLAIACWLLVIFTGAGILLDFHARRCSARGNATWITILLLTVGAAYEAMQAPTLQSWWGLALPLGVAVGCVIRAPGPWWAWLRSGETYQRRGTDRRATQ